MTRRRTPGRSRGHRDRIDRAERRTGRVPDQDEPMLRRNEHGLWETSETVRAQALASTSRRTVALEDEEPEPAPP